MSNNSLPEWTIKKLEGISKIVYINIYTILYTTI